MTADKDLQALDERLGQARLAYQSLQYKGSAPRPAALAQRRRSAGFWAALALPAAAAAVLLLVTYNGPENDPAQPSLISPSLNSVVEERPLSWRSTLPEERLAIVPETGNLSFSAPPRPRRPDEAVLLEDSSASAANEPAIG